MVGGPPIAHPYYPYQYQPPVQQPAYVQQPRPTLVTPTQPRSPAPVVRGQVPDETPRRPAKLEMPSPEALNVPAPLPPPDWMDLRVRLDRIGATGFSLAQQADGYHFRCQAPAGGQVRTFEGRGLTEAEAVEQALRLASGQ
jgi:hypothetical protein